MNNKYYNWTDNPTVAGIATCDPDILNNCLMHLKHNRGLGLPVGIIYAAVCSATYTPECSVACDGTEYTYQQFSDFYNDYIIGGRVKTCTYAEYASDIATYGSCVKIAVNTSNKTFKVPTIKNGAHIQQALSDSELGKCYNAGLPNIEILQRTDSTNSGMAGVTDVDKYGSNGITFSGSNTSGTDEFMINQSAVAANARTLDLLKSDIYKNDVTTVQTDSVALRYFMVIATGAINQSAMDWSKWATNLQNITRASNNINTVSANITAIQNAANLINIVYSEISGGHANTSPARIINGGNASTTHNTSVSGGDAFNAGTIVGTLKEQIRTLTNQVNYLNQVVEDLLKLKNGISGGKAW